MRHPIRLIAVLLLVGAALVLRTLWAREPIPTPEPQQPGVVPYNASGPAKPGQFTLRYLFLNGERTPYQVFLPANWTNDRQWPVIVGLHGSREKGTDGVKQLQVGLGPAVWEHAATFPAIVVLPQTPERPRGDIWSPRAVDVLDAVIKEYSGDPNRAYLTGISLGGGLAYVIATKFPDRFAAMVQVSAPIIMPFFTGNNDSSRDSLTKAVAASIARHPIWIFQGDNDTAVPAVNTRLLVNELKALGDSVRYTEYGGSSHDVWDRAYRTPELFPWLLSQHR